MLRPPTPDVTDAEALRRLRAGDLEPAATLYRRYGRGLFAYARSMTPDRASAEDIVQEAFLRLFLFEGADEIRSARAFLFALARRLAADAARKAAVRQKHRRKGAGTPAASLAEPPQDELGLAAYAGLQSLPPEQREVVVLKVLSELTFAEIGELLDLSPATAASRYRYALEKISERLKEEGNAP